MEGRNGLRAYYLTGHIIPEQNQHAFSRATPVGQGDSYGQPIPQQNVSARGHREGIHSTGGRELRKNAEHFHVQHRVRSRQARLVHLRGEHVPADNHVRGDHVRREIGVLIRPVDGTGGQIRVNHGTRGHVETSQFGAIEIKNHTIHATHLEGQCGGQHVGAELLAEIAGRGLVDRGRPPAQEGGDVRERAVLAVAQRPGALAPNAVIVAWQRPGSLGQIKPLVLVAPGAAFGNEDVGSPAVGYGNGHQMRIVQ